MTQILIRRFIRTPERTQDKAVRAAYGNLAGIVCILCNVLLFATKFLVGTLTGSIAISADAINNLSDASSNIVSLMGFKLAAQPADREHPYGHGRYEYLAGLVVSVMILVIGIELGKESLAKIVAPGQVAFSWVSIGVLLLSIAVKLWMALFNKQIGKTIHSDTLLATAADSRNDVVTTSTVLAATVLVKLTGVALLDGIMGLAVAAFILYSGVGLVKDTLSPLLGKSPDPALVSHIEKTVMGYPGVLGIHDLMVHDYGPGHQFASLHVEVPAERNVMESHDLIDNIETDFLKNDDLQVVIHMDPIVTKDPRVAQLRAFLAAAAAEIDPGMTIHDLRIVPGSTHTNVVFDLVVPHGFTGREDVVKNQLVEKLHEVYPDHNAVIKFEASYADMPEEEAEN